jgi:hypothetical protein
LPKARLQQLDLEHEAFLAMLRYEFAPSREQVQDRDAEKGESVVRIGRPVSVVLTDERPKA